MALFTFVLLDVLVIGEETVSDGIPGCVGGSVFILAISDLDCRHACSEIYSSNLLHVIL